MSPEEAALRSLSDERMEALARQLIRGFALAGVMEADGLNAMAQATYNIAANSQDERIRPGVVLMLREIADKLEAQDEHKALPPEGLH